MIKLWILAVLSAACCGPISAAAQEGAQTLGLAGRAEITPSSTILVLGHEVKNPKGVLVGHITNVLVDSKGQPQAAVLNYGGFLGVGHRKILVAWQVLRFSPGKTDEIILTLTMDQLKAFPQFKSTASNVMAEPPDETGLGNAR